MNLIIKNRKCIDPWSLKPGDTVYAILHDNVCKATFVSFDGTDVTVKYWADPSVITVGDLFLDKMEALKESQKVVCDALKWLSQKNCKIINEIESLEIEARLRKKETPQN